MLSNLRARPSPRALLLGSLTAVALCIGAVTPRAAVAQTPDPFGSGAGGAFGGSYVASPTSGELLPSYNFGPNSTAITASLAPNSRVSVSYPPPTAATSYSATPYSPTGYVSPTYHLGGSYCTLATGGQVWVPAGANPADMGCTGSTPASGGS